MQTRFRFHTIKWPLRGVHKQSTSKLNQPSSYHTPLPTWPLRGVHKVQASSISRPHIAHLSQRGHSGEYTKYKQAQSAVLISHTSPNVVTQGSTQTKYKQAQPAVLIPHTSPNVATQGSTQSTSKLNQPPSYHTPLPTWPLRGVHKVQASSISRPHIAHLSQRGHSGEYTKYKQAQSAVLISHTSPNVVTQGSTQTKYKQAQPAVLIPHTSPNVATQGSTQSTSKLNQPPSYHTPLPTWPLRGVHKVQASSISRPHTTHLSQRGHSGEYTKYKQAQSAVLISHTSPNVATQGSTQSTSKLNQPSSYRTPLPTWSLRGVHKQSTSKLNQPSSYHTPLPTWSLRGVHKVQASSISRPHTTHLSQRGHSGEYTKYKQAQSAVLISHTSPNVVTQGSTQTKYKQAQPAVLIPHTSPNVVTQGSTQTKYKQAQPAVLIPHASPNARVVNCWCFTPAQ